MSKLNLLAPRMLNTYLLVIITSIGAILRFYKLGAQSFWLDEVNSIIHAKDGYYDVSNPPLSYMILRIFLETLGTNEFTARLPSCLFGIATISLVYLLGKQLFSEKEGLVASFIIALSPWYIRWSQEARMYTQLTVLTILALYFFYHATHKNKITFYVLSSIFMALAFYTHYSGILILGIIILFLVSERVLEGKSSCINYRQLVIFLGIFCIICIPQFFTILHAIGIKFGGSETRWGVPSIGYFISHLFSFRLSPILSIFSILGAVLLILKRNRAGILLILYAGIPLLTFSLLISLMNIEFRYVIFTLPAYVLLASYLIGEIVDKIKESDLDKEVYVLKGIQMNTLLSMGVLVVILLGMHNLSSLYYYYSYGEHPDWRTACSFVESQLDPEDVVVSRNEVSVEYYLGRCDYKLSEENFEEIKNSKSRVWLLIRDGSVEKIDPDYEIRSWLNSHCEVMKEVYLITVYLYTPQNN